MLTSTSLRARSEQPLPAVVFTRTLQPPLDDVKAVETDSSVVEAAQVLLSLCPVSPLATLDRTARPSFADESMSAVYMPLSTPPSQRHYFDLPPKMVSCSNSAASSSSSINDNADELSQSDHNQNSTYYTLPGDNAISLALPEDAVSLSPLHCFMRKYCVEAFVMTDEEMPEVFRPAKCKIRIQPGRVGIRCLFCKHRPYSKRAERSMSFPSSIHHLYHAMETWQRRHSLVCTDLPTAVQRELTVLLHQSRSGAGGRRRYWEESARMLGMDDTPYGIRFVRPAGAAMVHSDQALEEEDELMVAPLPILSASSTIAPAEGSLDTRNQGQATSSLVEPQDAGLVSEYLYCLMEQMEPCVYSEQDRLGGRSKIKDCDLGYPGFQCKWCRGQAGYGRYFPCNIAALTSANSDRNLDNHVSKCRQCPTDLHRRLDRLRNQQMTQSGKNRRGSRKLFFERIWKRLQTNSEASTPTPVLEFD